MNTLTVIRETYSHYNRATILKDDKGHTKAIIPRNQRQPRYGTKTIVLNCNKFVLDWSLVEQPAKAKAKAKKSYYIKKKDKQNT